MITMQQLEELESRIIKALQLIGDLRTENSRFEVENEKLQAETEEAKLAFEEKEQEAAKIQKELDRKIKELQEIKEKEEVLEKKIMELLSRLDDVRVGSGGPVQGAKKSAVQSGARIAKEAPKSDEMDDDTILELDDSDYISPSDGDDDGDIVVETLEPDDDSELSQEDDDDIIIIDDDKRDADVSLESDTMDMDGTDDDDDIVLLDENDDIVIDNVDDDLVIIDESEFDLEKDDDTPFNESGNKKRPARGDEDEDFIIVEDDDEKA